MTVAIVTKAFTRPKMPPILAAGTLPEEIGIFEPQKWIGFGELSRYGPIKKPIEVSHMLRVVGDPVAAKTVYELLG